MNPDAIFIILLYITLLLLTFGSIIGLSRKIWKTKVSIVLKLLTISLLTGLLILSLLKFDTVETGKVFISRWEIMIYTASLLIGLNWSINLSSKQVIERIKLHKHIKVAVMTVTFATLIPIIIYFSANLFDKLNLLGSSG